MRDSNPQGQNPAVFKTAALPVRTNPPLVLSLKINVAFLSRYLFAEGKLLAYHLCKSSSRYAELSLFSASLLV